MSDVNRQQEFLLLSRFNARDTEAFVSVYKLFFTELHLYASRLYNCTIVSPEDAVQDVFCSLLENKGTHFESLLKLKAFLYTSIKNRYKSYLEHRKVQGKYKHIQKRLRPLPLKSQKTKCTHFCKNVSSCYPRIVPRL